MKPRWKRVTQPFRKKRARDNSQPVAEAQQLTLPDSPHSARPQSQPITAATSAESALTPYVPTNPSSTPNALAPYVPTNPPSTPNALVDPISPAPNGPGRGGRVLVQGGDNCGLRILYDPPVTVNKIVDIVFVHGLTGDAHDTWFHKEAKIHWPRDLLKHDIKDARLLSFGYDADVAGWWTPKSASRIGNHAEDLLSALSRFRQRTGSEQRKLIFVMHSLGGLVVQNALDLSRSSPEAYRQKLETFTVGLAFMGTPHFGTKKATWAGYLASLASTVKSMNPDIVKVLDRDSEVLSVIQKKFHEILRLRPDNIDITCFYETIPLFKGHCVSIHH